MSSASTTIPNRRNPSRTLSTLTMLMLSAVMVTITNSAQADQRYRDNSPRFNTSFNSSLGRDFRSHVSHVNRPVSRFNSNSRFDRNYNRNFNRNFGSVGNFNRNFRRNDFHDNRFRNNFRNSFRSNFRNYGSSYRYRPSRYDGWSVSLNVGSAWSGSGVGFGNYYYGAGLGGSPFIPYRNRTSVIVSQPTVVYVNDSPRVTGQLVQRETVDVRPARSLLRDIHGNCFERTYDGSGREMRIELPASACNF